MSVVSKRSVLLHKSREDDAHRLRLQLLRRLKHGGAVHFRHPDDTYDDIKGR